MWRIKLASTHELATRADLRLWSSQLRIKWSRTPLWVAFTFNPGSPPPRPFANEDQWLRFVTLIGEENINHYKVLVFLLSLFGEKMSIDASSNAAVELTPSMRRGISMLSLAYGYAKEVQRDDWEFALEIQSLTAAGVNNSELRWLVCKGFARHAEERASHGNNGRMFQAVGDVTFSARSCFILTDAGYEAFKRFSDRQATSSPSRNGARVYRSSRPYLNQ